jgi:BlaI family transcriptional regulator, penicillinase repressor
MDSKREFGELEALILNLIKKRKIATVGDIYEDVKKEVAYTTIMTVMQRLFEKSILSRQKESRSYRYWLKKESKHFPKILDRIKNKFFQGNSTEMISSLLEENIDFNKEDLEKLAILIEKAKNRAKK